MISSGGYFKYQNFDRHYKGRETFTLQTRKKKLCMKFDNAKPVHCSSDPKYPCNKALLVLERRITKTANLTVILGDGWIDPLPEGGSKQHASGIKEIILEVHEVITKGMELEVDKKSLVPSLKKNILPYTPNAYKMQFILPAAPKLYCTMLEVHDKAGNVRFVRRFVLFDNSSNIEINEKHSLRATSATRITGYRWQVVDGLICLSWKGRYYNSYYIDNNPLATIKPDTDNGITGVYDQQTGKLPVNGTRSIHGLTGFIYSYSLNNGSYTPDTYMSDFEKESMCFSLSLSDGDTYTFKITAEDIVENRVSESTTVHIDSTVPEINNLWLVRNTSNELYVHHSGDLSQMVLQFEAMDPHSGIYSVEWFLGTRLDSSDVGHGAEPIIKLPVNVCIFQKIACVCSFLTITA